MSVPPQAGPAPSVQQPPVRPPTLQLVPVQKTPKTVPPAKNMDLVAPKGSTPPKSIDSASAGLEEPMLSCTAISHASGNFFDLRPLAKEYPHDTLDWFVRGIDYPANFTLNFCAPLLLPVQFPLHSSGSVSDSATTAVVAHFEDGTVKSLGQASTTPKFRGRNLLLEYNDGSICLNPDGTPTKLRSSTLISFKCGHDLAAKQARLAFVGSPDNCTYFFEARTIHACPAVNQSQTMAPISIFLIILLVALVVYVVGTMVLHPSVSSFLCVWDSTNFNSRWAGHVSRPRSRCCSNRVVQTTIPLISIISDRLAACTATTKTPSA